MTTDTCFGLDFKSHCSFRNIKMENSYLRIKQDNNLMIILFGFACSVETNQESFDRWQGSKFKEGSCSMFGWLIHSDVVCASCTNRRQEHISEVSEHEVMTKNGKYWLQIVFRYWNTTWTSQQCDNYWGHLSQVGLSAWCPCPSHCCQQWQPSNELWVLGEGLPRDIRG